jgi:hypothetical protein
VVRAVLGWGSPAWGFFPALGLLLKSQLPDAILALVFPGGMNTVLSHILCSYSQRSSMLWRNAGRIYKSQGGPVLCILGRSHEEQSCLACLLSHKAGMKIPDQRPQGQRAWPGPFYKFKGIIKCRQKQR